MPAAPWRALTPARPFRRVSTSPEGEVEARGRLALLNFGLIACLVGVLVMLTGRFVGGAPAWLVWPGLAVIALGWALLALSAVRRPPS